MDYTIESNCELDKIFTTGNGGFKPSNTCTDGDSSYRIDKKHNTGNSTGKYVSLRLSIDID